MYIGLLWPSHDSLQNNVVCMKINNLMLYKDYTVYFLFYFIFFLINSLLSYFVKAMFGKISDKSSILVK